MTDTIQSLTGAFGILVLVFVFVIVPLVAILMPFYVIAINGKLAEVVRLLKLIHLKK